MQIDTSKPYSVVNKDQISTKNFETEEEAKKYAEFMTEYHTEKYEVKYIDYSEEDEKPKAEEVYSMDLEMPTNAQEGITNFVQMIINEIEAGNATEALLKAVDLRNDLETEMYKVTMDNTPEPLNINTYGVNQR